MREGIWRNRCGQRMLITRCDPVDGQQWTDGLQCYSDDGRFNPSQGKTSQDLVEYIGMYPPPKPPSDKTFEIERLQRELQQAEMERIAEANTLRVEQAAEIERLQAELRGYAADSHRQLRNLQESHNKVTANLQAEQRGEREGFRIAISMILEKLNA
ncbi:MAG: hypothetical protein RIT02_2688 [Planctomycetota bacterium]